MKTRKLISLILLAAGLLLCSGLYRCGLAQETAPASNPDEQALPTPETLPVAEEDAVSESAAPLCPEPSLYDTEKLSASDLLIRTGTYLALIIGLIFLMGYISRHLLRNGSLAPGRNKKIRVIDSAFVEQKKHVYLVKVLDRAYVLASGADGLRLIDKFEDAAAFDEAATEQAKEKEAQK